MFTLTTFPAAPEEGADVNPPRRGGASRRPLIAFALALAAAGALSGCGDATGSDKVPESRSVRVSSVQAEESAREVRISGITRASRRATLAFLVAGTLHERAVDLGQRVVAGDTIARLYNPALAPAVAAGEARVRELDARLEQLERDVRRADELRDRALISDEEAERVKTERSATLASRDLAAASLAEARNQLAAATLIAPFDGAIDAVLFEPGEFVAAGQPVIRLSGTGGIEVELEIPETLIARFLPGREVRLTLPFLDQREVAGEVVHVGDAGGEAGGLFPVEIALAGAAGLRPGLTVELVMELTGEPSMVVPLAAILDPGTGRPRVFRARAGRVEPVFVEVGQLYGDRVAIAGDLAVGDEVVVTGLGSLTPGQAVEILR
jgi:RND family efflux transporter MFP subunit